MRAMVLSTPAPIESAPLRLHERAVPHPGPGEIRVRVRVCGICRTDLHVTEGELPPQRPEIIPGHQVVGVVDALGAGASRLAVGTRVGIAWLRSTCGTCPRCRAGNENLCAAARFTGYHEDGGFADYTLVREDFAYTLPPSIGDAEASPLLCAGIIGYRALRRANVTPGCRLGLYGFGAAAHLAIQVAQHWKCRVFVMTRDERHRVLARELGAHWTGAADAGELVLPALDALDHGGTLALGGIHLTDIPRLEYERHLFHEKNLRSVTANTRQDGEEFLRIAGEIPIRPHTEAFRLADANEALRRLKHDAISGAGVLRIAPDM